MEIWTGLLDIMSDRDDGFECLTGMLAGVFDSGAGWVIHRDARWIVHQG